MPQYKDKSPVDNGPQVCLHANPPSPSDGVRRYIQDHDQFSGCAETKGT